MQVDKLKLDYHQNTDLWDEYFFFPYHKSSAFFMVMVCRLNTNLHHLIKVSSFSCMPISIYNYSHHKLLWPCSSYFNAIVLLYFVSAYSVVVKSQIFKLVKSSVLPCQFFLWHCCGLAPASNQAPQSCSLTPLRSDGERIGRMKAWKCGIKTV